MVRIDGREMHVMTQGEGRTVLLLHGNPTWSFLWRKVFKALEGKPYRLVAPDLMGLGLSSRIPSDQHTLFQHGHWLTELIDLMDLRDLIFVGQDWGGPIGLRALAERRDRLAGMVILNTVIGPPKADFKPTAFHKFARQPIVSDVAFRLLGYPQRALDRAQGDRSSIQGDVAFAYKWPLRAPWLNQAPLALARMVPDSHDHVSVPQLQMIADFVSTWSGPSAIVWGDKDPILGRVRTHVERSIPHARVTRTQAGHFLQEEVPAEIAAAIEDVASRI
jgi:haloalkane dehalogenase